MSGAGIPRFYQIVETAEPLARFVPQGLRMAQLRIKDRPREAIAAEIDRALALCGTACALVVNDHWDLAIAAGATWVHLGQEDLDTADVAAIRAAGLRLGISTHSPEELARALGHRPDYVALGPVFPTQYKAMAWAPQGLERVAEWRALLGSVPLVAIGGLTPDRAAAVYAAGADCLCVVTDVLRHPQPEARLAQWLALAGDADPGAA